MDDADLKNRFDYHAPATDQRREDHDGVRAACFSLADYLNVKVPDGREKALAITNLEQVMFWANAAIARQPQE